MLSKGRHFGVSAGPADFRSGSQMIILLSIASWLVWCKVKISERDGIDSTKETEDNQ